MTTAAAEGCWPSSRSPPAGLCKLDLQLVSQTVESIWLSALYPVNAMRNRALANARTEAVLLLDVDFWPSAGKRAGRPAGRAAHRRGSSAPHAQARTRRAMLRNSSRGRRSSCVSPRDVRRPLPSPRRAAELSELMQKPAKYASLVGALGQGAAVVLPAYETGDSGDIGVEVAREAVLGEGRGCSGRRGGVALRRVGPKVWQIGKTLRQPRRETLARAAKCRKPSPALGWQVVHNVRMRRAPGWAGCKGAYPAGYPIATAPHTHDAEGKDAAVKMFWDGRIKAFHTDRYEAGHRATDYKRWLEASRPYNIQ